MSAVHEPVGIGRALGLAPEEDSGALVRVDDLHKAYDGQAVLKGVSLELRPGEVILLRGNNGSGKTTLLNILTGQLAPDGGAIDFAINGAREVFRFPRAF